MINVLLILKSYDILNINFLTETNAKWRMFLTRKGGTQGQTQHMWDLRQFHQLRKREMES